MSRSATPRADDGRPVRAAAEVLLPTAVLMLEAAAVHAIAQVQGVYHARRPTRSRCQRFARLRCSVLVRHAGIRVCLVQPAMRH
mgnify:CR=1 FL=1